MSRRLLRTRAATRAFYNKLARVYDLLAESSEEPLRRSGLQMLRAAAGERILEIGPGTGHCLAELVRSVGPQGRVYGVDLAEKMLLQSLPSQAGLVCGDAVRLPFPSATMDAVFMSFTLELFETPEIPKVLAECRRVLRSGGRLVVVALSKSKKRGLAVELYEWAHRHFPNFVDCRPIYARRAIEAAGFRIRDTVMGRLWVPVEIVLARKP
jgi:demethylmenaquinone methyltransferase/2-methoxy-6-polyprenyl-1,4-benzoquinol methylase